MTLPSDVELNRDRFIQDAHKLFPTNHETLEHLFPMVDSLRGLARHISRIVREPEATVLSETATGD